MVHVFNFCSWEISDFDFPICGHLFLFTSRYCRVPQNQCSTSPPFFILLLYSDAVCFIGIFGWSILDFLSCVNLFVRVLYGLPYFNHRAVLSFWTAGRLVWKVYQLQHQNLHQMVYLKKRSTALLHTGVLSSRIIGEEFFLLLNSV